MNKLHPLSEKIVTLLEEKTQSSNKMFFRVIVAYYLAIIASTLRVCISGYQKGTIPVNIYAIALSPSGSGKGNSTSFIEQYLLQKFIDDFNYKIMPCTFEKHASDFATYREALENISREEALEKINKDYVNTGNYLFQFDSATVPAIKQQRTKLLFAGSGALNLQVDEIGSNLINSTDVLNLFLELYDLGKIKDKLVKNTLDNKRVIVPNGSTPANMLLFGTPSKLLDGSETERAFFDFLETGYARRCLFSLIQRKQIIKLKMLILLSIILCKVTDRDRKSVV